MRLHHSLGAALLLASSSLAKDDFQKEINSILARSTFQDATVGVQIRDLETGEVLYTKNQHRPLTPASNQKLLTSAAVLETLGSEYTYDTAVSTTASIDANGKLDGDIWLVGSGDPSLTSARLGVLAESIVAETGLKEITGGVYGDGGVFDREFLGVGWSSADEPFYYSAQVAGLNCDLNIVNVTVSPGAAEGDKPRVLINGLTLAEEKYVQVDSSVETDSENGTSNVLFDRVRGENTILLSGSIPVGGNSVSLRVTIHDPTAYTAYRFALALEDAGVKVNTSPQEAGCAPDSAPKIATSTSDPLPVLLKNFMKPSDNMYGEAFFKTLGHAAEPDSPGSSSSGSRAVRAYLDGTGINTKGLSIVGGSGLSRGDALTNQFICDLLVHARETYSDEDWQTYYDALPIGGVDGTLSSRFVSTPAEGKVRAKTGSLTGVSALSGYLEAGSGKEYVFSILMTEFTDTTEARRAQDDIVLALYEK